MAHLSSFRPRSIFINNRALSQFDITYYRETSTKWNRVILWESSKLCEISELANKTEIVQLRVEKARMYLRNAGTYCREWISQLR